MSTKDLLLAYKSNVSQKIGGSTPILIFYITDSDSDNDCYVYGNSDRSIRSNKKLIKSSNIRKKKDK